jgi:hypothetical protein
VGVPGGAPGSRVLGGDKLMSSGVPWTSADRMYGPATRATTGPSGSRKIDGSRVTLAQPMRIDITAAELGTDFQQFGPVITDCGVEALTIVTNGSRDANATHLLQWDLPQPRRRLVGPRRNHRAPGEQHPVHLRQIRHRRAVAGTSARMRALQSARTVRTKC